MRAITFIVTPPQDFVGYKIIEGTPEIRRERIYHFNVLDDETIVLLAQVSGDLDRVRTFLEQSSKVIGYQVSSESNSGALVYVHVILPEKIKQMLQIPRTHEVFFDSPIEGTHSGRLRFIMIGETNEVVQEAFAEIPDEITTTVERIGPYPEEGDILSLLTERQKEVLHAAIEEGYYASPREATHQDIAERMDLSPGTVTEHLQKIEARVFGSVID